MQTPFLAEVSSLINQSVPQGLQAEHTHVEVDQNWPQRFAPCSTKERLAPNQALILWQLARALDANDNVHVSLVLDSLLGEQPRKQILV